MTFFQMNNPPPPPKLGIGALDVETAAAAVRKAESALRVEETESGVSSSNTEGKKNRGIQRKQSLLQQAKHHASKLIHSVHKHVQKHLHQPPHLHTTNQKRSLSKKEDFTTDFGMFLYFPLLSLPTSSYLLFVPTNYGVVVSLK